MSTQTSSELTQKVDDLIFICGRLSALLDKESIALERGRADELDSLLEEKNLLCRAYESRGKALLESRHGLETADIDMRVQLRDLVRDMERKIEANTRYLAVQIEANRRFFDALAIAARDNAPSSGVYSNTGSLDDGPKPSPKGLPLSIDQSL